MQSSRAQVSLGAWPSAVNPRTLKTLAGFFRKRTLRWLFLLAVFVIVVLSAAVAVGSSVDAVKQSASEKAEAEKLLSGLGYWTGPAIALWGSGFRDALIAFQKVEGRKRTGRLTTDELVALRSATRPRPRFSGYPHIEVDLRRQVLFVVDATDTVTRILPVCTGNDKSYSEGGQTGRAYTPRGKFKVVRKINGWRRSPLGLLYYPNYIYKGWAIHGSPSMPAYPASHGCIRIPMFAAKEFSALVPVGTVVDIYDG